MATTRRQFFAAAAGLAVAGVARARTTQSALTPEMFGAKGDGRTNDTAAFIALAARINANGGGSIALRPVTYVVGMHGARHKGPEAQYSYPPGDILHFVGCRGPVRIQGNGARLRCAPGLRFGTFNRETGRPSPNPLSPEEYRRRMAGPYRGMIFFEECRGPIEVSDIELDGNLGALRVGGKFNEKIGWHGPGSGLLFMGNRGQATISRVRSHHHPLDGMIFIDAVERTESTLVLDSTCDSNGRQGCSVTGGSNYAFKRCRFERTGRAGLASAPGAGVDIEAEGVLVRNVAFSDCTFSDNHGFALVAGSGDSENIRCDGCTFIGTTDWTLWAERPRMRFSNCTIIGTVIRAFGDPDPSRAAQFTDCTFTDDPSLSPTGKVFTGINRPGTIAYIPRAQNVLFRRCHFRLIAGATLPETNVRVIYADCDMSQRAPQLSRPIGTYSGTNRITGSASVAGSRIRGVVTVDGRQIPATD